MRYEYYNQECSLIEAYDLEINGDYNLKGKGPKLYFSKTEETDNEKNLNRIKKEYKSLDKPVIVFQPFGASAQLFDDIIKSGNMIQLEPYFRYEYYNQECSLAQAFDLEINGDYCIGDKTPRLYFSRREEGDFIMNINNIKEEYKSKEKPVLVFQPFGASASLFDDGIFDFTNRSFVMENIIDLIQLLRKDYLIIWMGSLRLNISNHDNPIVYVNEMSLREWAGYIKHADHFLGCDSVGQHIVKALDKTATVVIGSTVPINITYPDDDNFDIIDIGKEKGRIYSPIRVSMDDEKDRQNDEVMMLNEVQEQKVIDSCIGYLGNHEPFKGTFTSTQG